MPELSHPIRAFPSLPAHLSWTCLLLTSTLPSVALNRCLVVESGMIFFFPIIIIFFLRWISIGFVPSSLSCRLFRLKSFI